MYLASFSFLAILHLVFLGTSYEHRILLFIFSGKGHFSKSVDNKQRRSLFIAVPDDYVVPQS